jgi:serine/threonine protein kinase
MSDQDHITDSSNPILRQQHPEVGSVPLSDRLMSDLREARAGTVSPKPMVEDVLSSKGLKLQDISGDVLTDLVYAEWMLRLGEGESPRQEEYQLRFPMITTQLRKQWLLEESLESLSEETVSRQTLLPTYIPPEDGSEHPISIPLEVIGKYKVICELGAGGQANVYRAHHPELSRDVVIKIVRPRGLQDAETTIPSLPDSLIRQVIAEGRLLAQLNHPNIAQIYDADLANGYPILVMEYIEGQSLDQYQRTQSLSWREIADLLARIARATAAAHARGIVHRDIKPQNIVIRRDGVPKLIDFGLSQMNDAWNQQEQPPGISGTLGFMAPEQARGDFTEVGPAVDIFSLGAVLYFLLTGHPPYHGSSSLTGINLFAILDRAKRCEWDRDALEDPKLPVPLVSICTRAMAPLPSERFATAIQFAEALEAFFAVPKANPRTAVLVLLSILVIGVFAVSITLFDRSPQNGSKPADTQALPVFVQSQVGSMSVRVHRDSVTMDLNDAVPIADGESMSVMIQIPAHVSVTLYSINGTGQLQRVATVKSQEVNHAWRYPEEVEKTVPLTGPIGTECLLCIGETDTESSMDQIQQFWDSHVRWPALPASTVLRLVGRKVTVEQRGRDLGSPIESGLTPTDQVTQTLERFVGTIGSQTVFIEGLVFCHADAK